MRILLAEDDKLLGDGVCAGLKQAGFAVDWVTDGAAAETALKLGVYEAMILDLGLPKQAGLDILKSLRSRGSDLPVLILTARDTVADRVTGLDTGADDYMIKPFDLGELTARVRALLRRRGGRAAPLITYGPLTLDPASHKVTLENEPVDLSPREFALLQILLEHQGRVLSRARLEESLYPWNEEVESNAVEVHIHHLRKKLIPGLIRTVRGVGYIVDKEG